MERWATSNWGFSSLQTAPQTSRTPDLGHKHLCYWKWTYLCFFFNFSDVPRISQLSMNWMGYLQETICYIPIKSGFLQLSSHIHGKYATGDHISIDTTPALFGGPFWGDQLWVIKEAIFPTFQALGTARWEFFHGMAPQETSRNCWTSDPWSRVLHLRLAQWGCPPFNMEPLSWTVAGSN